MKFIEPKTGFSLPPYDELKIDSFDLFVTPGAAGGDGSEASPFGTIEAARDAIRAKREAGYEGHINVKVGSGFIRTSGIDFDSRDGDVTYFSDGAVISGGITLTKDDFVPVSGEMRDRLHEDVRDKVLAASLRDKGMTADDWGKVYSIGAFNTAAKYDGDTVGLTAEVFCSDRRMTLARWPNEGFEHLEEILDQGDIAEFPPQNYYRTWKDRRNHRGGTYIMNKATNARVKTWKPDDDIWAFGYFQWDWADSSTPVRFDTTNRLMMPKYVSSYGVRRGAPFYFYNVFEELDAPGEYYIDRENGILYIYPFSDDFTIDVSTLRRPLIKGSGVKNLTVAGFELKCCLDTAVVIEGDSNTVRDCLIDNVLSNAVTMTGTNNLVKGCEVTRTGRGGITITGGDRPTLTPGNNIAEDNYIHDWSQVQRTYTPALAVHGVGNICRHNEMRHSPQMAITYSGNDNIIEYNLIVDCVRESSDAGAIYSGYDWTAFGNHVDHNVLCDIGAGEFVPSGIYFDDAQSGQTTIGNLMVNIKGFSFLLGGGRSITCADNLICDPGQYGIHYDDRARDGIVNDGWARQGYDSEQSTGWIHLRAMPFKSELWAKKYPELAAVHDNFDDVDDPFFPPNPQHAVMDNNIVYTDDPAKLANIAEGVKLYADKINNIRRDTDEAKEVFADPENGDYTYKNRPEGDFIDVGLVGRHKKQQ